MRIRNRKMWKPATVINNAHEPQSYVVQAPEGGRYHRNQTHLLKLKEWNSWQLKDSEEEDQTTEEQDETQNLMLKETTQQLENLSKHYITRSG